MVKQRQAAKVPPISHSSSECFQKISWKRCWYLLSLCNSISPWSYLIIVWPSFLAPLAKVTALNLKWVGRACSLQLVGHSFSSFMTLLKLMLCCYGMRETWCLHSKRMGQMDTRESSTKGKQRSTKYWRAAGSTICFHSEAARSTICFHSEAV